VDGPYKATEPIDNVLNRGLHEDGYRGIGLIFLALLFGNRYLHPPAIETEENSRPH
jgi:hypothetical protein